MSMALKRRTRLWVSLTSLVGLAGTACSSGTTKTSTVVAKGDGPKQHHCALEDSNLNFVLNPTKWANLNVSASVMPDGSDNEGTVTSLQALLDGVAPREVWMTEYARALHSWAKYSPLNFRIVADDGSAEGISGAAQADNRFGDIRLASRQMDSYVGWGYGPATSGTRGGDVSLDPDHAYKIGEYIDLYSLLVHEVGHAVGMRHSTIPGVVMYPDGTIHPDLKPDDIAGIQAQYGARPKDQYDAAAANDTPQTATTLTVGANGATTISGDLTSGADLDHYRIVVPAGAGSVLSVGLVGGVSLLAPKLRILDDAGVVLQESQPAGYGAGALLQLADVAAGQAYRIAVDRSSPQFDTGAYRLVAEFKAAADGAPYTLPAGITPDARDLAQINDSIALPTSLGTVTTSTIAGLSLHWTFDVDHYHFTTAKGTRKYKVSVDYDAAANGPVDIVIYNAAKAQVATSAGAASVTFNVSAGVGYYAKVVSKDGRVFPYTLNVLKQ